eukprot:707224-Prymnesium_polylepis.2
MRRHQPAERLDGHMQRLLALLAPHAQLDRLAAKAQVDEVDKKEALLRPDREAAVVGNLVARRVRDHIISLQVLRGGSKRQHASDEHARGGALHAVVASQLLIIHRLPEDAERAEAVGLRAVAVGDKVLDRRHRDDVADVLRLLLVLEGDANHVARLVERWPSAVARIDRRIDLDGEQVGARVHIPLDLDARYDAHRNRDALAALRVADHRHLVLQRRHRAKLERRHVRPELFVFDGEHREVALVPHLDARRHVLGRIARLAQLDVRRVQHHVRIREHVRAALVRHLWQTQRRPPMGGELEGERRAQEAAGAGEVLSGGAGGSEGCARRHGGPGWQLSRGAQGAGLTRLVRNRKARAGRLLLRLAGPRHVDVERAVHRVYLEGVHSGLRDRLVGSRVFLCQLIALGWHRCGGRRQRPAVDVGLGCRWPHRAGSTAPVRRRWYSRGERRAASSQSKQTQPTQH